MTQTFAWPNGKRIAVLVSVLFESWSDGKSPHYFTRTTPLKVARSKCQPCADPNGYAFRRARLIERCYE